MFCLRHFYQQARKQRALLQLLLSTDFFSSPVPTNAVRITMKNFAPALEQLANKSEINTKHYLLPTAACRNKLP